MTPKNQVRVVPRETFVVGENVGDRASTGVPRWIPAAVGDRLKKQGLEVNDQDHQIEELEEVVAQQAGAVFAAARERALASGSSVVESVRGVIYEVFPDGHRREVKRVAPPTRVVPGTRWILR